MSVIVLSPHRDDAAFSCGLLLQHLAKRRVPVLIANICTISDYAPYVDLRDAGNSVVAITRLRAQEDNAFLLDLQRLTEGLKVHIHQCDLAWQDAPLRLAMPTEDVLIEHTVAADAVTRLGDVFSSLPAASVVLAPLSLGGHIDHRLVLRAALIAWTSNTLLFYEDLPYACRLSAQERAQQTQAALPWLCFSAQTPRAASGDKRKSALFYSSQIVAAVADEMEDYAAAMGWTERLYGSRSTLSMLDDLSRDC